MRLEASPADALTDAPLWIRLAEVPAREVAVAASAADGEGNRWRSECRFTVTPEGTLDLRRVAPISGSYDRADPMGLLWSMGPPKGEKDPRFRMPWDGFDVELEAVADGERASATVRRRFAAARVERVDLEDRDLAAALFLPPAPGPHPGVAMFHGSGGGIAGLAPSGALLASHGFAALVVGYFGSPDARRRSARSRSSRWRPASRACVATRASTASGSPPSEPRSAPRPLSRWRRISRSRARCRRGDRPEQRRVAGAGGRPASRQAALDARREAAQLRARERRAGALVGPDPEPAAQGPPPPTGASHGQRL
jgi:hypothetical protein